MHHVLCPVEEPLIVWAQGRAIGDNQRLLAGAPGTATALCVVCRRWGDVAQVYRVERRNVHTQLHGGRAEHQGQPFKWRPVVRLPFVLVFLAVSKALLENLSGLGVDLCRVLLCLEFEQRVRDGSQQFGRALVECTEVGIWLTWLLFGQGRCQAPVYERCVEAPAEQALVDGLPLYIPVVLGSTQHVSHQRSPFFTSPFAAPVSEVVRAARELSLDGADKTGPFRSGYEVISPLAFAGQVILQNQIASGFKTLVLSDGPAIIQACVTSGYDLVLFDIVQVAAFDAQFRTHPVEQNLIQLDPLCRGKIP